MKPPDIRGVLRSINKQRELWLLSLPIIVWVIVFSYVPMYGMLMAFFKYIPGQSILAGEFAGLQYFIDFAKQPVFLTLLRNTLVMSGLRLTIGFVCPIIFALLLNEIGGTGGKRFVQTLSYMPHFISWVVAGNIIFMLLSSDGIVNQIAVQAGLADAPVPFLSTGRYYWVLITVINIWKELGWSAIIYLAAITGVDAELYQAGAIDGLGRFGLVLHITLPSILPTILILWIMGIGGILNAGFDQHLIIGNPLTQQYWDVIDTYVYRYGIQQGNYSMATAASLFKSVIGFGLVYLTNRASRKAFDLSLY